jgi:hypothetical protein
MYIAHLVQGQAPACQLISSRRSIYFAVKVSKLAILDVLEQQLMMKLLPVNSFTLKNRTEATEKLFVLFVLRSSVIVFWK